MLKFLADENFNNDILRGLVRRVPELDLLRVQDVGLAGADDPTVLEWAAGQGRVLLTHDVATITHFAYERLVRGEPMPGVFEVPVAMSVGELIDELVLIFHCSLSSEWDGQVRYLPLR